MAALLLAAAPGPAAAAGETSSDPEIAFERYRLDNGLEVILHRDDRVPVAVVDVWYHVGSGNERVGKSGFAHLFEHMLFQGSKHTGEDQHFAILKQLGATGMNGTTNSDRTNYYELVPAHELETALWLESDRMGYLLPMINRQSLDNQIEVVRNERRQRIENVPYGSSYLEMHRLLYPEGHPYRYTTIGKHEDLQSASVEDVTAFYKTWYVPANATLFIGGDIELAATKALVQKWFGSFPKSTQPTPVPVPMPTVAKVRSEVKDALAAMPMVSYAWHAPAIYAPGDAEMDILAHVLGASGTGRLFKRLVHEEQLAQDVSVAQLSRQFSSIFDVSVQVKPGQSLERVEAIIAEELEKLRREPISQRELARAVAEREAAFVWGLESLLRRAETLQGYNHYLGSPDQIKTDLDRYRQATPEGIQKYAREFLSPEHRVDVITVPSKGNKS